MRGRPATLFTLYPGAVPRAVGVEGRWEAAWHLSGGASWLLSRIPAW